MRIKDIKIGDRVRIRQWDDMKQAFGVDGAGDIKAEHFFTTGMRHLCGREATVASISGGLIRLKDWSDEDGDINFSYSAGMLEKVEEKKMDNMIVITADGKTTTARMTGERQVEAIAKCSPEDKFDFLVGAEIATQRLFEKMKPFKPKMEERYWYVREDGDVDSYINAMDTTDYALVALGNCFRTKKEAKANKDKIMEIWSRV